MNYHIARDGQQIGIFTREDVLSRYSQGEIRATDLAWCEGMANWAPVSEVFGAATPPTATVAAPPPAAAPGVPAAPMPLRGPAPTPGVPPPKPANYLVPAILVTLFCCLPFGIPAIIFASQVDSKYNSGDYAGAQSSADKAKMWMWISVGIGVVGGLVYLGVMFFGVYAGARGY